MCEYKDKFNERFRISSSRLQGWDYTNPGHYFVTICTEGGYDWFGKIIKGNIKLSEVGKIVDYEWKNTARIRKNIHIGEWTIMPNHIHGIVIINYKVNVETSRRDVSEIIKVKGKLLTANSLGSIIGQFKSICTKKVRLKGYFEFKWQTRFYDHVIRNEKEYYRIRNYIKNNPKYWEDKRRKGE